MRRQFPSYRFLPPVEEGDMIRLADDGIARVGIIDGFFGDRRSVSHKEILFAMSRGLCVYGAASMGALRAAELDSYGMVGVGKIYEKYRCGLLTDDGDVAIAHAPEELGFAATSVALVDAEATMQSMLARGRISKCAAEEICGIARAQYFATRTWASIASAAFTDAEEAAQMAALFKEGMVQAKQLDALMLLDRLAKGPEHGAEVSLPVPPRTVSFLNDLGRARQSPLTEPGDKA